MIKEAGKLPFPHRISAVLFDMDGVVLDSMRYHEAAWREVLLQYGVSVVPEDIYRREGMSGLPSIRDIFIEKKLPVPDDQSLNELIEKKHTLFNRNSIGVFEGIADSLELLKNNKIALGLVTGSHFDTVAAFLPSSVQQFFEVIISADDVHKGKPDPEPYITALNKIQVLPENALIVENAPMGILSAFAAGIFCIAIETTLSAKYLQMAGMIVEDHDALFRVFENITESG